MVAGVGDAEHEVEQLVRAAEVDRLRRAIMAVATQQDFGLGPMAANGAQQAAQQGPDLLAAGPSGGTQNGGDEAAGAVEDDDRLKAVFVIVRIEQPQLLAAVDGVEHVVDVEGDALGDLRERFAIEVNHGAAHAQQRAASGRFSRREIVDCEHRSRSDGERSCAI